MRIEQRWTGQVLTLSIRGWLSTLKQTERLRHAVDERVRQGHRKMVIDLGSLRRVGNRGLDTLTHCLRVVRKAGGELKLAAARRRINELIVIGGLLRVFDVHDTVPEAIRAFDLVRQAPLALAA